MFALRGYSGSEMENPLNSIHKIAVSLITAGYNPVGEVVVKNNNRTHLVAIMVKKYNLLRGFL